MQYLHGNKKIIFAIVCFLTLEVSAQEHRPNDDARKFHFGISVAPNFAKAKVTLAKDFYQRDSVRSIGVQGFSGLNFGGIVDYRIGKYFTLRYLPQIEFSQRNFTFNFSDRQQTAKTETVSLNQCFLVKHHSTRHRNHRFYVLGGVRYSHDFQSNENTIRSPNLPIVAFKANSLYYEMGFGYDHYGLWSLISTEIKMSNSLGNMLSTDPYIYSSSISRIQARLFQISFHFHN
ncbi:MAG: outer membrane beta-barrel protein [Chitinophagaceae bacterium]